MRKLRNGATVVLGMLLSTTWAAAQEGNPPPPRPADQAPAVIRQTITNGSRTDLAFFVEEKGKLVGVEPLVVVTKDRQVYFGVRVKETVDTLVLNDGEKEYTIPVKDI